jgi:hypothetical protein
MLLHELSPLRVFAWWRGSLLVRLVDGHMLVDDVQCLFGGRELDGQDALAVVDGLGSTLPQLCAFAVGSAVLVEERVVAVVREAVTVVLSAVPAVVEAVPVSVNPLYRVHATLGDAPLLPHLVLGLRRRLQSLDDAHADLGLHLLPPIVRFDRLQIVGRHACGRVGE